MSNHYICLQYLLFLSSVCVDFDEIENLFGISFAESYSLIRIVSSTTPGAVSLEHGFTHDKSVPCLFSSGFDFFYGGSWENIVRLSISCKRAKT